MARKNEYKPQTVSHPGETLAEILEEIEMGPKEFAVRTDKPEKTITAVLNGESSITTDMALQFENVLKVPATFWLQRQHFYDEAVARTKKAEEVSLSLNWAKEFPIREMIKLGWLPQVNNIEEKTEALLKFFGLYNHVAWEKFYLRSELKVQFRISLAHTKAPQALSAWLRKGDLDASELEAAPYSDKKFKEALPKIKQLMAEHPDNFFHELQNICLEAGVKVVHTPCLPKAPINGSTRWLKDTPLIQLTGRYNRNDNFWFTFFHEAGHILLHGKKDIFLEKVEYDDKDLEKEREADTFAIDWTLKETEEREILSAAPLKEEDIIYFAKKFTTHPALIIGRFQHKKLLPYSLGREFFQPVVFDKATC